MKTDWDYRHLKVRKILDTTPVFSLADPADFKAQMETAGFSDVEVEFGARDLDVPDFVAMGSTLTVGESPVQVLFDRVGPSGKERLRDRLRQIKDERFGGGPI